MNRNKLATRSSGIIADPRLVDRTRLFVEIDELLSLGAAYLCGTAGIGKSTLATSYAYSRKRLLVTINMQGADADIFNFVHRLESLCPALNGKRGSDAPTSDPIVAGRRAFVQLFNSMGDDCLLLVDELERVSRNSPIHDLLTFALNELPPAWSMVLVGRDSLPAAYARAQASGRLASIGESSLRLTDVEASEIARRHARKSLSRTALEKIVQLSDGWAALTVLLANAPQLPTVELSPEQLPEVIFSYMAEEVLRELDEEQRRELEQLSQLSEVDETIASVLTGNPDTAVRLAELAARHFFVEQVVSDFPHDGSGTKPKSRRYRMHGLFRSFLQHRSSQITDAAARRRKALETARVLTMHSEYESAVDLQLAHQDFIGASAGIVKVAPSLVQQQRYATLSTWIKALPEEEVGKSAELSLWAGAAVMLCDPVNARIILDRSFALFDSENRAGRIRVCCLAIDSWLILWDNFHGMDKWIQRLDSILLTGDLPEDVDLQAHICSAMLHASLFRGADVEVTAQWYERGSELLDSTNDPSIYMMLAQGLILVSVWTGRLTLASMVLERVRRAMFRNDSPGPLTELWFRTFEAGMCWNLADRQAAENACKRGIDCAEQCGARFSNVLLLYHASIACLVDDDADAASSHAAEVSANTHPDQLMNTVCEHQLKGLIARAHGKLELAIAHLEEAAARAQKAGLVVAAAHQFAGLAYVSIEQDNEQQARKWFARAREYSDRLSLACIELDIRMGEAWLLLRTKQDGVSGEALEAAFSMARRDERVASAWWSRPMLSSVCAAALEAEVEVEYVRRIIRKHALEAPVLYRHLEPWPWPVRIYLLGKASIMINDSPLESERRGNAKPIELIYALVAVGGEASADTLADMLWPDAEGDSAMDSFKTTLSRARRRIGIEGALRLSEGRLSLDNNIVWSDVRAVTELAQRLTDGGINNDRRSRFDDRIIHWYKADLLENEHFTWVTEARRPVRELWLRAVLRKAETLVQIGKHDAAAAIYERAIDCSPQVELLYRRAMDAHLDAGTIDAGVLVYERCVLELAHSPDGLTRRVHQKLRDAQERC